MKLLSIRLHPFGGISDRTCHLVDGLNVLEGPNEYGKSTLSHALWHALFTTTAMSPGRLETAMGRWYPKPGGDHTRVTLEFEAGGSKWTLQKAWGAVAVASLQADGAAGIADPVSVQEQLNKLLCRNEATWRHVLFTGQAQLTRTMEDLRVKSEKMDDVQAFLAGAAAIPGDVPADKLVAAIAGRIEKHFNRWDRNTNGPEKGRGIGNPWSNMVGPLLEAYYSVEKIRSKLAEVVAYENEVDEVNGKIKFFTEKIAINEEFIVKGRSLRAGLSKRDGVEERCKRLVDEQKTLKAVMLAWPGADQGIQGKQDELVRINGSLLALDEELKSARKRQQAEQLRQSYGRVTKAKEEWDVAIQKLRKSKGVDLQLVTELKRLEPEITRLRIEIAAQKLTARLECSSSLSVKLELGSEAAETLKLTPAQVWEGQADGKISLAFQDLKISVESGTGDVAALFTKLEAADKRQQEILQALGHESLFAAEVADKEFRASATVEQNKKDLYQSALQGRTEAQWVADITALDALPETRSVDTLESERGLLIRQLATIQLEIKQLKEKVEQWVNEYVTLDALMSTLLERTDELKKAKLELASLPVLPEGFASISDYLKQLQGMEDAREDSEKQLEQLRTQWAVLSVTAQESTAEELLADMEAKNREFQRQQATGHALLRIESRLLKIIASSGTEDPMKGLATSVSRYFRDLTDGRYQEVRLKGTSPVEVEGATALDAALLSQGALGSLALATRLALADLYLDGMEGFLLLDDPFTDMDPSRRHAAECCLGEFAKQRQVLFFTCHPDHARELQDFSGAKIPTING